MLDYIKRILLISAIIISFGASNKTNNEIKRVWAIDDGEKIKRDDITNPLATDGNNLVWKKNTINIFGAKNEIVAFQLILQAGESGAKEVNVSISDLKNGKSIIPGSAKGPADPFDYRGRNVELFTEHYLNITKRSPGLWFNKDSAIPSSYYIRKCARLPDPLFGSCRKRGSAFFY